MSWKIVEELYSRDSVKVVRHCTKLAPAHIHPTNFQKMGVSLPNQIVSHSVASGIKALYDENTFTKETSEKALFTSEFMMKMNTLFDILNGKPSLTRNSPKILFLIEMRHLMTNIKLIKPKAMAFCFDGMALTISSILSLTDDIFEEYSDFPYFHFNKLQQDPLENFFSHVRSRSANKPNPSLFEFNSIIAKIISLNLIFSSKFSNCEKDSDEILD